MIVCLIRHMVLVRRLQVWTVYGKTVADNLFYFSYTFMVLYYTSACTSINFLKVKIWELTIRLCSPLPLHAMKCDKIEDHLFQSLYILWIHSVSVILYSSWLHAYIHCEMLLIDFIYSGIGRGWKQCESSIQTRKSKSRTGTDRCCQGGFWEGKEICPTGRSHRERAAPTIWAWQSCLPEAERDLQRDLWTESSTQTY